MDQLDIFSIRSATAEDTPAILQFIRELATYENLLHEVTATVDDLRLQLFGPNRRAEVLLPCEHGVPVGFALFFHNFSTFLGKPGIYIEDIFIRPEARGRGYGRALMIDIARLARDRGCGRLEWAVLDWNRPAIEFYRSLGATPLSEWTIQRVSGADLDRLAAQSPR